MGKIEYWIGLTDREKEGTWKWESITAYSHYVHSKISNPELGDNWHHWYQNEPNNARNKYNNYAKDGEDCAVVGWRNSFDGHQVWDTDCNSKKPVLCVKGKFPLR